LKQQYLFKKRGTISVKGRGEMVVYFLTGHNDFGNHNKVLPFFGIFPAGNGRAINLKGSVCLTG